MSSKFGRNMRHRSKPAICRAPRPPGPVDPSWPPKIGQGLCLWTGPNPYGPDYTANGLCCLTYYPSKRNYEGLLRRQDHIIKIKLIHLLAPTRFNVHLEYWINGNYSNAAFSDNHPAAIGQPVVINATDFYGPYPGQTLRFRLSAFPFV